MFKGGCQQQVWSTFSYYFSLRKIQFLIYLNDLQLIFAQNACFFMRKTPVKMRPLQQCIDAFHKSPMYECRIQLKGEENKLKKIGRNKLIFKQSSLPYINQIHNKQNEKPHQSKQKVLKQTKEISLQRGNTKNLSFAKSRLINMEEKLSRMVQSQREINQGENNDNLKELALKKQFYIRDKKMLPQRNCMSATNKKQKSKGELPAGVKQIRKARHVRKSQQTKQEQQLKLLPAYQQAQKIAEQARPYTAPNASKHPMRSASLEDFLNEWKTRKLE